MIFKKIFFFFCLAAFTLPQSSAFSEDLPQLLIHDFDSGDLANALGGSSGAWNLNPDDENQHCDVSLDPEVKHGDTGFSLKLDYDMDSPLQAQGGFWTQLSKKDLKPYDHLNFFVRGDAKAGFTHRFRIEFKKSKAPDSSEKLVGSYIVEGVGEDWKEISIPLNKMCGITDWSDMDELVIVLKDRLVDHKVGILYFDDFRVVHTGNPGPSISDSVAKKTAKESDKVEGEARARVLAGRLKGFPKEVLHKRKFSEDSKEFLKEVAKDTWGFFRDIVDQETGLPLDNIAFPKDGTLSPKTFVGDYTNVTNVGLYLMCLVSGLDFGFINEEEACERIKKILDTIEKLESYKGFLYNYYDTTTADRTSNFVSYVDEGWLTMGLIVVKNALPKEFGARCQKMIDKRDFSFFYDPVEGQMFHGFYTNLGVYAEYHYGAFFTEPRAISYMSIGRGQAPLEHWFMMSRTMPKEYSWQSQEPQNRFKKQVLGQHFYGGHYLYHDMPLIPSWGGSLFEALMPTIVIDEKNLAPKGLGLNDERHVKVHISYAKEELGYPVWGMSPCSVPPGDGYSEYGVLALGMKPYGKGVVTPHVTFLSLEFAPEEVVKNLRKMLELYPIYGEYGFYDAVHVESGVVSTKYLCLDQAMSFIALNNYLNNGAIRKRFMSDPIAEKVKDLLTEEKFFEE